MQRRAEDATTQQSGVRGLLGILDEYAAHADLDEADPVIDRPAHADDLRIVAVVRSLMRVEGVIPVVAGSLHRHGGQVAVLAADGCRLLALLAADGALTAPA